MMALKIAITGGALIMHTTFTHLALMTRYNHQTLVETWQGVAKELWSR